MCLSAVRSPTLTVFDADDGRDANTTPTLPVMSSGGSFDLPTTIVDKLIDVRHMTLAGLTVVVYDILLTMDQEVNVIWKSPKRNLSKIVYTFYRYATVMGAGFVLAFMIPLWHYSDDWCKRAGVAAVSLTALSETAGNAIVLNELIKLWACSKTLSSLMVAGFLLVHSGTLIAIIFSITELHDHLRLGVYNAFRMCTSEDKPQAYKGIFIPSVVLQFYWSLLLYLNAMSRPRSSEQRLWKFLWGDGLVFFMVTFGLRVTSLIIAVAAPGPVAVLGVVLPILLVNTVVCRLYLWLNSTRGRSLRQKLLAYGMEKDGWREETELQVRSSHSSAVS